ncbi:MAG: hypothetical protein Q9175_007895, partial [Cornicularia normoerica]
IDVAVNAPEPGTIKEFLANEEDTVTVGQDLLKLELGAPPKGGEKQQGGQEPKAPASEEQSTSSDPKPQKDEGRSKQESPPPPPHSEKKSEPSKQESKPNSHPNEPPEQKEPSPKPQESRKPEPKIRDTAPLGNREERRASFSMIRRTKDLLIICEGENESHALAHLRASKTVSEYRSFPNNVQRSRYVEPDTVSEIVQG